VTDWIDYAICESCLKTVFPLCNNFIFLNFKEDEKLNQTQKLDKKLVLLMDNVQAEKQSQFLEVNPLIQEISNNNNLVVLHGVKRERDPLPHSFPENNCSDAWLLCRGVCSN